MSEVSFLYRRKMMLEGYKFISRRLEAGLLMPNPPILTE